MRTAVLASALLIGLASSVFVSAQTQSAKPLPEAPASARIPSKVVLTKGTPVLLRLSAEVSSNRNQGPEPILQVFRDVKVGNLVVVTKSTPATFFTEKEGAGNRTQPGSVELNLSGVRSIRGDDVLLAGAEHATGRKETLQDFYAEQASLFTLPLGYIYLHARKGDAGKLPAGTLVSAYVEKDVVFDTVALEKLNDDLEEDRRRAGLKGGSTRARLHFYSDDISASSAANTSTTPGAGIRFDGAKAGHLQPGHYACAELEPGVHAIKVGHQASEMTLEPAKEYFFRVQFRDGDVFV